MSLLDDNVLENTSVLKNFPKPDEFLTESWFNKNGETINSIKYSYTSFIFKDTAFEPGIAVVALNNAADSDTYSIFLCFDELRYEDRWCSHEKDWSGNCDALLNLNLKINKSSFGESYEKILKILYKILNNTISCWQELIINLIGKKGFIDNKAPDIKATIELKKLNSYNNSIENNIYNYDIYNNYDSWNTGSTIYDYKIINPNSQNNIINKLLIGVEEIFFIDDFLLKWNNKI